MSNEARLNVGFNIDKPGLHYQSRPTSFQADVAGANGPTPGSVLVGTSVTVVNFAALTALGGLCTVHNMDLVNYVTWGIKVGATFYPLGEILPGELYPLRLSRQLLTGVTGTAHVQDLAMIAHTAPCRVQVMGFDP